jgi:hypothetical protein
MADPAPRAGWQVESSKNFALGKSFFLDRMPCPGNNPVQEIELSIFRVATEVYSPVTSSP